MKRSLNLLVLSAFLFTSMPFNTSFAGTTEEQDEETIEVPQEAVELSERLVSENDGKDLSEDVEEDSDKPSCIKSGVAYSPRMTKKQRKELFVRGQITDCEGNIWNIKVIPGSDKSKEMTVKSWRFAGRQAKQMFKIETYKKAFKHGKGASKASFNFAKGSTKLLKKGIWDYMIVEGVYNDLIVDNARVWKQAGVTVAGLRGSFGWLFGAIYAGILKPVTLTGVNILKAAYHITAGTVILVGGVAGTAGGIVATVASPVIVPVVEVMTKPLLAVGSILTTGTIIPGVVYVWNGTAWVSTQLSHVPDSETVIGGVRFVRLENPKKPVKPTLEVTTENLNEVVATSVKGQVVVSKQTDLKTQREELEKKIRELQLQVDALRNASYKLDNDYQNDPSVKAVSDLIYKQYSSTIVLNSEVAERALNDQELREMILQYAEENGIKLSNEQVDQAISKIKQTMKQLGAKE